MSSSPCHFVNVDHQLFKIVCGGQYRMEAEHCLSDPSFVYRLCLLPESHEKMGLAVICSDMAGTAVIHNI